MKWLRNLIRRLRQACHCLDNWEQDMTNEMFDKTEEEIKREFGE